jgi:hypothetical protein
MPKKIKVNEVTIGSEWANASGHKMVVRATGLELISGRKRLSRYWLVDRVAPFSSNGTTTATQIVPAERARLPDFASTWRQQELLNAENERKAKEAEATKAKVERHERLIRALVQEMLGNSGILHNHLRVYSYNEFTNVSFSFNTLAIDAYEITHAEQVVADLRRMAEETA